MTSCSLCSYPLSMTQIYVLMQYTQLEDLLVPNAKAVQSSD